MKDYEFADVVASQEKQHREAITKALNGVLNSKETIQQADELNDKCGGWPYPPTKEMLALYEKVLEGEWKSLKKAYDHLDVSISVNAPQGKPPSVTVEVKHRGEYKGGQCYVLRTGDTMASIAMANYGHECYAKMLYERNAARLGFQCKQLPAGFEIDVPRIFVPQWKTPPKATGGAETKVKAINILHPAINLKIEKTDSRTQTFYTPGFTVYVTLEVGGNMIVQRKGTINGAFELERYKAAMKQSLGPFEAAFRCNFLEKSAGGELSVSNSMVRGLAVTQKVTLKKGKVKVTFGTKKVSFTHKDLVYEGEVTVAVEIEMTPNPPKFKMPKVSAQEQQVVLVLGLAAVTVAIGVTIISGGAGAVAAAALVGALAH